jgi:hypothetical protein
VVTGFPNSYAFHQYQLEYINNPFALDNAALNARARGGGFDAFCGGLYLALHQKILRN